MEIKLFNSDPIKWDNFVESSNNGTIFQKLKFLSYHPKSRFDFMNLIFTKNDTVEAVLPGGVWNNSYVSPVGASFGSIITNIKSLADYEKLIDSLILFLKKAGIEKIQLTPPPTPYMHDMHELERYLLTYKGFKISSELVSNIVDLKNLPGDDILKGVSKRFRLDVKNSHKFPLSVKIADSQKDFEDFYSMLLTNKRKFGSKPTHTLEEMLYLSELFPNETKLFLCYENSKLVAGIWLILANRRTALTFYIAQYYEKHQSHAVSRLLYEILLWLKSNSFTWLDLGVSMDTKSQNPMEPSRSLVFFKESLNSKSFVRTTYFKNL